MATIADGCGPGNEREELPDSVDVRGDPIDAPRPERPRSTLADSVTPGPSVDQDHTLSTGTADEPLLIGFDHLSGYEYRLPEAGVEPGDDQIPAAIRGLDGRYVAVKGFMLPTKLNGGRVTEFLLMRDQSMCCFGVVPKINEWVSVKMSSRGVKATMDQPVLVLGVIRVGEIREHGILVGLYRMEGHDLADPLDL
jgi:hypothetical protein